MKTPVSRADHDLVVRFIAAKRFPFPDQKDWPADNLTITNETDPRQAIATKTGTYFPDIVIVSTAGTVREVAEVETGLEPDWAERWQTCSQAADNHTTSGAQHFFVYVPDGLQTAAADTLENHHISCAGLRAYTIDDDQTITIVPITTGGDPKDHVVSSSR